MATAATVTPGSGTESGKPSADAGQATGTAAPATADKGAATTQPSGTVAPAVPELEGLDAEFPTFTPEQKAALKKALTPKFQKAAELAKSAAEREASLGHLASLVDAAKNGRSKEVIQALAAAAGVKVNFDEKVVTPADTPAGKLQAKMAELLGDDAAAQLAPLITEMVRSEVGPVQQATQKSQAEAMVERYFAAHPESAKYRDAITKLSARMLPGTGVSVDEWLDSLATIASSQDREAEGARKALEAITASANGSNGTPRAAVSDAQVTTGASADEGKSFSQILKETAKELAAATRR